LQGRNPAPNAEPPSAPSSPTVTLNIGVTDVRETAEYSYGYQQALEDMRKGRAPAAKDEGVARDVSVTYEIWQDDFCVAGSDDLSDARHYLMQYSQDGPCEIREVTSYSRALAIDQAIAAGRDKVVSDD